MKFVINPDASIQYERKRSTAPFVKAGKRYIYLSSLETAWQTLLRHRLIVEEDAMKCADAIATAEAFAARLTVPVNADPVIFAGGRFALHRDTVGNVTLLNPQRDVLVIQQDRWKKRQRIIVGHYASVRQAVWSAVQQSAYASTVEQAYGDLDAFMHQLAQQVAEMPMPVRTKRSRKEVA